MLLSDWNRPKREPGPAPYRGTRTSCGWRIQYLPFLSRFLQSSLSPLSKLPRNVSSSGLLQAVIPRLVQYIQGRKRELSFQHIVSCRLAQLRTLEVIKDIVLYLEAIPIISPNNPASLPLPARLLLIQLHSANWP